MSTVNSVNEANVAKVGDRKMNNSKDSKKSKKGGSVFEIISALSSSKDSKKNSSDFNSIGANVIPNPNMMTSIASAQDASNKNSSNSDSKTAGILSSETSQAIPDTNTDKTSSKTLPKSDKNASNSDNKTADILSSEISQAVPDANTDKTSSKTLPKSDKNASNSDNKTADISSSETSQVVPDANTDKTNSKTLPKSDLKIHADLNTDYVGTKTKNDPNTPKVDNSQIKNEPTKITKSADISSVNKNQISNDISKTPEIKSKDSISATKEKVNPLAGLKDENQARQIQSSISNVTIQSAAKSSIPNDKNQSPDQNTTVTGSEKTTTSSNVETTITSLHNPQSQGQFTDTNSNQNENFQNVTVKITNIIKQTTFISNQTANSTTLNQIEDQKKQNDLKNYQDLPQVSRELEPTNTTQTTAIKSDDSNQTVFSTRITNTIIKAVQDQQVPVKVEIQLNPPSLGKVEILLTEDGGKTSLILNSDNQKTQELLKSTVPMILDKLSGLNFNVVNVQINGQEWYQSSSNDDGKQKGDENNRKKKDDNSKENFEQMFKKGV